MSLLHLVPVSRSSNSYGQVEHRYSAVFNGMQGLGFVLFTRLLEIYLCLLERNLDGRFATLS